MEPDSIDAYLNALARDDCFKVDRVLKSSPHEITEVVYFIGENSSEFGPFVRKTIDSESSMGKGYALLFEAQLAGKRFRHLPKIHDVHERDGKLIVLMEYVTGRTLRDEVYEKDPSLDLAARLFPLLCDGVMELHEMFSPPIIHRDLKPSNVVVNDGGLTVIDLGIARMYREGATEDTVRFGTRSYAPPEQFGFGQTNVQSDVYSLGMMLAYLLTERDPEPTWVASGFNDPGIPPSMRPVLQRACAFDPAQRYASVRQLKEAFLLALKPSGAQPQPPSGPMLDPFPGAPMDSLISPTNHGVKYALNMTRNIVVTAVWVLFMLVLISMPFAPDERYAQWPFALLAFQYWAFGIPFFSGIAVALLDFQMFGRRIPALGKIKGVRKALLAVGLVIVGVMMVLVTYGIASAMGLER